jgi:hypothetical protein
LRDQVDGTREEGGFDLKRTRRGVKVQIERTNGREHQLDSRNLGRNAVQVGVRLAIRIIPKPR